jgi:hypothetical protein
VWLQLSGLELFHNTLWAPGLIGSRTRASDVTTSRTGDRGQGTSQQSRSWCPTIAPMPSRTHQSTRGHIMPRRHSHQPPIDGSRLQADARCSTRRSSRRRPRGKGNAMQEGGPGLWSAGIRDHRSKRSRVPGRAQVVGRAEPLHLLLTAAISAPGQSAAHTRLATRECSSRRQQAYHLADAVKKEQEGYT